MPHIVPELARCPAGLSTESVEAFPNDMRRWILAVKSLGGPSLRGRIKRPAARTLVALAAFALMPLALPAGANHPADDKTPNIVHLANRAKPGTNSDLAFWKNLAFAGNYGGFRIFDISNPANPVLLSDFACNGPQSDVSVYKADERLLLFQSVDTPQTRPDCTSTNTQGAFDDDMHWEGVRVFDVTNPSAPVWIKSVYTDCGSHTHTTIPDDENQRAIIYVSSYPLSPTALGPTCPRTPPTPGTVIHAKISVIEVPDKNPAEAAVVNVVPLHQHTQPAIGPPVAIAGTQGCHDITAFTDPKVQVAAAACLTEGQLWDISDLENPCTQDPSCHTHIDNESVEIWHSSTLTWDGKIVLFGDEHGGALLHGCNGSLDTTGNIWFYRNVEPGTPTAPLLGRYITHRVQPPQEFCTMHNFNVIPVSKNERYIGVSSAYEAGTTVFDFTATKTAAPYTGSPFVAPLVANEIAHFDAQNFDGFGRDDVWSTYWYNDYIWANGGLGNARSVPATSASRGLDVLKLLRTDLRRQFTARTFHHMNPQTQEDFQTLGA
jgi:hypothetical protein